MLILTPLTYEDYLTWEDDLASPFYDYLTDDELREVVLARGTDEPIPEDIVDDFTWSEDND